MAWLRVCLIGLIAALALLLGACGNREPEARRLHRAAAEPQRGRRRRTGRPAVPEQEERQALGDYAQAYGIMSDYQAELRKAAQPLRECCHRDAALGRRYRRAP